MELRKDRSKGNKNRSGGYRNSRCHRRGRKELELPKTVNVTYNTEKVEENVVWNTDGIDFQRQEPTL